jgi:RND family efflux transporter MFP subunit
MNALTPMNDAEQSAPTPSKQPPSVPAARRPRIGRVLVFLGLAAVIIAFSGVSSRKTSDAKLEQWTRARAIPTVTIINPRPGGDSRELVLPGDVEAYYNAPIHAQVSGYVKTWRKDIGAKVKAGDILAEIDTPEIDQQIAQAKEELAKTKANQALALITAKRWTALRSSNAVSQQAADEKESDASAKDADVAAAQANVDRVKAQKDFANIVAPFDGVVTARNIDVGALVNSSTNGSNSDLFSVADVHEMRIYVKVPQNYTADLHPGMTATLKLPQFPDRTFEATIATTSNAISKNSRSLLVELMAKNDDGALLPGAFAQVIFKLPADPSALRVPASALLFHDNSVQVATVGLDDKVVMKKIEISRDFGSEIEVARGVSANDRVIDSPSDSIDNGDQVKIKDTGDKPVVNQASQGTP